MLGANKNGYVERLNANNVYVINIDGIKYRDEPIEYNKEQYRTKSMHVARKIFCNIIDARPGDRFNTHDEKKYVLAGVPDFTDGMGQHMEMVVREMESYLHEEITLKTKSVTQTNYDPILLEWDGSIGYDEATYKVLLDPKEAAREAFIKVIEAGKLEEIDWIMTIDLQDAENFTADDKVVYQDIEYDIKWLVPQPFQYLAGLVKSIRNYRT